MRRFSALLVVPVIAWCLALVTHGVLEIVHHRARPGVIASLVVLPLLITVCALIALGLWRERPNETDSL
jgi:uncharacterized membrane protein YGL010W